MAVTSTYNAATGVWTASGAIAAVNALLAGVTLTPALNFNGSFSIATSVSDGVAPAITGSKAFTGIAVNDAPTATNLSTAETYTENTPLNLVDIVVSDVDSANVTATLTLSNPTAGSLSTATSGAVTSTYNAATGVWTASGAIADVNALLAGVTLTPALNFNGSFSIATSVSDGVAPAITGSKAFTGIAVNDAPTATNLSTAETYTENTPLNLVDIVVSDADSANVTATLTLSNPTAGSLSTATSGGVTSTYTAATGVWTASGAIAAVNALLAGVTLTPALNFNGSFSIATSVSDGVAPAITGSKAFTGIAVNDAPTATNLSTAETYTENTPLNLVDIVVSDADSANVTATLTLSNPTAGSLSTATSGGVTSTYTAATGVWTASGAIAAVNALLAGVTLTPALNFNGSFSIATSVSDGVAPAITGSKAFTGIVPNFNISWSGANNGNWSIASNWNTGTVPGPLDSVFIGAADNVIFNTGSSSIDQLDTVAGSTVSISGGTLTIANTSNLQGSLSITSGALTDNGQMAVGTLAQTGGTLNGSGTLTATGASSFSGGTQSGSGTTFATGGAAFSLTSFGLDGGRTLQLGGSSTATGTLVQISLNAANPNTGVSDAGSGILTIASGATFNDQTTSSGLTITAPNRGGSDTAATAAVNNAGTFIKCGSALTSTISSLFNNTGTVDVQSGTLSLSGGGTDIGAIYQGRRHRQLQRWHPDAGRYLSHQWERHIQRWADDGQWRRRHRLADGDAGGPRPSTVP